MISLSIPLNAFVCGSPEPCAHDNEGRLRNIALVSRPVDFFMVLTWRCIVMFELGLVQGDAVTDALEILERHVGRFYGRAARRGGGRWPGILNNRGGCAVLRRIMVLWPDEDGWAARESKWLPIDGRAGGPYRRCREGNIGQQKALSSCHWETETGQKDPAWSW